MARGLGSLAAGAGQYNVQTAAANSVNADTVMRLNEYMYQSQQESNKRYYERQNRKIGKANATAAATQERLRNQPEPGDIDRGDALNVLLDDLTSPALMHSSGLRFADSSIPAPVIFDIPFRNAADAVTICIDQLLDKDKFPRLLQSEALAKEREAFIAAAREARRQGREQDEISPEAVKAVQTTGRALYDKAKSPQVKATPDDRNEALNYLKAMAAFAQILENPNMLHALKDLKKVETTHVSNLIAFMHVFNLRFGPAVKPEQKIAYQKLYPILKGDRDKGTSTIQAAQTSPPPPPPSVSPTALFHGVPEQHLNLAPPAK